MRTLRFALRQLAKNPGTTAVVVTVLAIAIAANTVVFSVVYARLLRPLPYPEPDRLVQIWEVDTARGGEQGTVSPLNFLDWQRESRAFRAMAVYGYANLALTGDGGAERLRGVRVSGAFFSVLGVEPLLGRALDADEEERGGAVVLSHDTWRQRFAADPEVVGRTLWLDGQAATVVGVMPRSFRFPTAATEVWVTPAFRFAGLERGQHFLFAVGRLRPGATAEEAEDDLSAVAASLAQAHPGTNRDSGVALVPLHRELVGDTGRQAVLLWAGTTLVLLLACANLAALLLARTTARRRELAVRRALGGSRGRIVAELLTESAVLAGFGGTAGVLLASWVVRWLAAGHGPRALHADGLEVDPWILAFSLGVTTLTALLCGLLPALRGGRGRVAEDLRRGDAWAGAVRGGGWTPRLLVTLQVAATVILLSAAGLLVKSVLRLQSADVGFEPAGVTSLRLSLPEAAHPDPAGRARLYQRLVERLAGVPGVDAVGGVNDLPFSGSRTRNSFEVVGRPPPAGEPTPQADYRTVVGDYLEVLGLERLAGEGLPLAPRPEGPAVAVVNQRLVERYLGDGEALGERLDIGGREHRIVGVVENLRHSGFASPPEPEIYVHAAQGQPPPWLFLAVRSGLAPANLAAALRPAAAEIVPGRPLFGERTLGEALDASVARERSQGLIVSAFAAIALLLAVVGLYGTLAYAATRQRREIAIRLALGGRRGVVMRPIFLTGLAPALAGIALGLLAAVPGARALEALLYGVSPLDPAVFLLVPAGLLTVAAVATWLPARRAVAVDPAVTLRDA